MTETLVNMQIFKNEQLKLKPLYYEKVLHQIMASFINRINNFCGREKSSVMNNL